MPEKACKHCKQTAEDVQWFKRLTKKCLACIWPETAETEEAPANMRCFFLEKRSGKSPEQITIEPAIDEDGHFDDIVVDVDALRHVFRGRVMVFCNADAIEVRGFFEGRLTSVLVYFYPEDDGDDPDEDELPPRRSEDREESSHLN